MLTRKFVSAIQMTTLLALAVTAINCDPSSGNGIGKNAVHDPTLDASDNLGDGSSWTDPATGDASSDPMTSTLFPCDKGTANGITVVGWEDRTFLGKTYKMCHDQTIAVPAPSESSGTPKFKSTNVWHFVGGSDAPISLINYTVTAWTGSSYDVGVIYSTGKSTCGASSFGVPTVKQIEEYVLREIACVN